MAMMGSEKSHEALYNDNVNLDKYLREYIVKEHQKNNKSLRPFSIISIRFVDDLSVNKSMDEIFSLVTGILRGSDKFIPLSAGKIVILLPDTGADGAHKAIGKISDALNGYADFKGWKSGWFKIQMLK